MAVQNIFNTLKINDNWSEVQCNRITDSFVIAIKNNKGKHDTIDPTTIRQINFLVGIDSGVKNIPIIISRFNINFNDSIEKNMGFARLRDLPTTFYIKVESITDDNLNIKKEGTTSISLNINNLK